MKINFDQTNDVVRIVFQKGKYDISKEVDTGVILDFTKDSKIMAIEILDASEKLSKKSIQTLCQ